MTRGGWYVVLQVPSFAEPAEDAGQIFDVPPERLGEIAPGPDFDQGSYALLLGNSRDEAHRTILWTVLIATVGFLAMLTLRLVRQGRRTSDGDPPAGNVIRTKPVRCLCCCSQ